MPASMAGVAPRRFLFAVEYHGGRFSGWQGQPGAGSVQEAVHSLFAFICGAENVGPCVASSRTDRGVHAIQNVFHVDVRDRSPAHPWEARSLLLAVNSVARSRELALNLADAREVPWGFSARFDAIAKTYCYRLLAPAHPLVGVRDPRASPVLHSDRAWVLSHPVSVAAMRQAAQHLVGTHDFATFRAAGCDSTTSERTLTHIEVVDTPAADRLPWDPPLLPGAEASDASSPPRSATLAAAASSLRDVRLFVRGNSFMYHMVRNLAGFLVRVGASGAGLGPPDENRGLFAPEQTPAVLARRDRSRARFPTAPAHGLCVLQVEYPPWEAVDAAVQADEARFRLPPSHHAAGGGDGWMIERARRVRRLRGEDGVLAVWEARQARLALRARSDERRKPGVVQEDDVGGEEDEEGGSGDGEGGATSEVLGGGDSKREREKE